MSLLAYSLTYFSHPSDVRSISTEEMRGTVADARRQCRSWLNKGVKHQEEEVEAGKTGRRYLAKEVWEHTGHSLRTCQCKEQAREGWSMEELKRLLISSLSISKPLHHLLCLIRPPMKLQTALHYRHCFCIKMQKSWCWNRHGVSHDTHPDRRA